MANFIKISGVLINADQITYLRDAEELTEIYFVGGRWIGIPESYEQVCAQLQHALMIDPLDMAEWE